MQRIDLGLCRSQTNSRLLQRLSQKFNHQKDKTMHQQHPCIIIQVEKLIMIFWRQSSSVQAQLEYHAFYSIRRGPGFHLHESGGLRNLLSASMNSFPKNLRKSSFKFIIRNSISFLPFARVQNLFFLNNVHWLQIANALMVANQGQGVQMQNTFQNDIHFFNLQEGSNHSQ
jgi:hypothetical protein